MLPDHVTERSLFTDFERNDHCTNENKQKETFETLKTLKLFFKVKFKRFKCLKCFYNYVTLKSQTYVMLMKVTYIDKSQSVLNHFHYCTRVIDLIILQSAALKVFEDVIDRKSTRMRLYR